MICHLTNISLSKSTSLVGFIRRSFKHLDINMFRTMFTAVFRPHLEYGAPIMESTFKKTDNHDRKCSNESIKNDSRFVTSPYQHRLEVLKLPTLQYRRYRGDMIEMFKLSHCYYDEMAINEFIEFRSKNSGEQRLGGHRYHVNKGRFKKDVRRFSFKCRVTEQWNHQPKAVVDAPNINTFKNRLDRLWERDGVMHNPDIDVHIRTSKRNTQDTRIST